jgi:hypothetical protein
MLRRKPRRESLTKKLFYYYDIYFSTALVHYMANMNKKEEQKANKKW